MECRIKLPGLSFQGYSIKHFPGIRLGGLEIATVTGDIYSLDNPPASELLQAHAGIAAADIQRVGYFLRIHRLFGDQKEGVDTGHGTVDTPEDSHGSPGFDESIKLFGFH